MGSIVNPYRHAAADGLTVEFEDDFNRANEYLAASSDWNDWDPFLSASDWLKIVSNEVETQGGNAYAIAQTEASDPDMWAEFTPQGGGTGVFLRADSGTAPTLWYEFYHLPGGSTLNISRSGAVLLSTRNIGSATTVRVEVVGSTIKVFGDGTQIGADITDATYDGSGGAWAGIASGGVGNNIDDFKMGIVE